MDSALPLQGAQVRSLVRELRSHMPHGAANEILKCQREKKGRHRVGSAEWQPLCPLPAGQRASRAHCRPLKASLALLTAPTGSTPVTGIVPSEGLPRWLSGRESACTAGEAGDAGSISGSGRSPGENGNLLHYSCRDNSVDRGAWQATVHGVTDSQTQLNRHNSEQRPGNQTAGGAVCLASLS